jgi:hypothetical protein
MSTRFAGRPITSFNLPTAASPGCGPSKVADAIYRRHSLCVIVSAKPAHVRCPVLVPASRSLGEMSALTEKPVPSPATTRSPRVDRANFSRAALVPIGQADRVGPNASVARRNALRVVPRTAGWSILPFAETPEPPLAQLVTNVVPMRIERELVTIDPRARRVEPGG